MLPLVGESETEQLRERVQELEAGPTAVEFDPEGEPVLEFDESAPLPVRAPWTVGGGDVPVRVGVAQITADAGGGMYTISEAWSNAGALELKTNGFEAKTAYAIDDSATWAVDDYVFYIQIQKASGGSEYYIERGAGGPPYYSALANQVAGWQCFTVLYVYDSVGKCVGWYYDNGCGGFAWESPWDVEDPAIL